MFKKVSYTERNISSDRISNIECSYQSGENYIILSNDYKTAEIFRVRNQEQAEIQKKKNK